MEPPPPSNQSDWVPNPRDLRCGFQQRFKPDGIEGECCTEKRGMISTYQYAGCLRAAQREFDNVLSTYGKIGLCTLPRVPYRAAYDGPRCDDVVRSDTQLARPLL